MNDTLHLSLLETYNKIKDELKFKEENEILSFSNEKIEQIFKNSHVLLDDSYKLDRHFANVFLNFEEEYIPLFFFQTKVLTIKDKKYLRKDNRRIIINPYAINALNLFKIPIDYFQDNSDPQELCFKLTSALKLVDIDSRFILKYGIKFYNTNILYATSLFDFLRNAIEGKTNDKKIIDFFKTINEERELSSKSTSPFAIYKESFENIKNNHALRIVTQDNELTFDYLTRFIDHELSNNRNICFVVKDEKNYNIILEFFKKKYLSQLVYSGTKYTKKEMLFLINRELVTHFYNERKIELQNYMIIKNKMINLTSNSLGNFPFVLKEEDLNYLMDIIISGCNYSVDTFLMDKYTTSDLNKDIKFIKKLDEYQYLNIDNLKNNVFYGLSSTGKRQNFDLMMVTMVQIVDLIKSFNKLLIDNDVKLLNNLKIINFEDFEIYGKQIELLNKYNGFPKKYFEATITDENTENLQKLKKIYQNISSSKLVVQALFKKKIFKTNIKNIILNYDLKGTNRTRAKVELSKLVKNKKEEMDYSLLIKILRAYINSQKELDEKLPSYIADYGDTISTMNGVMEIESNIKYIAAFNKMKKKFNYFNLDNELIKKFFKGTEYRNSIYDIYLTINKKYQEIKNKINLYIGYFLDDDYMYLKSDFVDLENHFKMRILGKYEEFNELSTYNHLFENSSKVLQNEVQLLLNKNESLKNFKYYYFTSLVKSYQRFRNDKFKNQTKVFSDSKCELIFSILTSINNFDRLRQDIYFNNVKRIIKTDDYQKKLSNINKDNDTFNLNEIKILKQILVKRFPLTLIKTSSLPYVDDYMFDNSVVLDSFEFDEYEIFSSLRIARNTLLISKNSHIDNRLSIYDEYKINPSLLYLNQFNLKSIPDSFIKLLKKEAKKRDYKIVTRNPIFPIVIENIDGPIKRMGILPDIFISSKFKNDIYLSLPKFLIRTYNLPIYYMDTLAFLLNPLQNAFIIDDEIDTINSMYSEYLIKRKTCKFETEENKYKKEFDRIINGFEDYIDEEEIQKMLNMKTYDELFYKLQPVKKEIIEKINDEGLNRYINYMKDNVGLIIYKDGFYMDVSKGMIKFRKSNKKTRTIEDLSIVEFMQGIKEFVSSFKSFDIDRLKNVFASLLDYDVNDPDFSLRFEETIFMLKNRKIITISNSDISLLL